MAKAFASQGDLSEKGSFLELGDGIYAVTAEGDSNSVVITGDALQIECEYKFANFATHENFLPLTLAYDEAPGIDILQVSRCVL